MNSTGRAERWGLLGTALVLGVLLIGSAVANWQGTMSLSHAAARGQGEALLHGIRRQLPKPPTGPPDSARLSEILEELADIGLLYVAIVESDGVIRASAGEATMNGPIEAGPGIVVSPDRVWLASPLPPPPGMERRPMRWDDPQGGRAPFGLDDTRLESPEGPRRPPKVIIEFQPQLSRAVQTSAVRNLAVSMLAALVLMVAAAVFWRQSTRADALQLVAAEQKHLAALGEMSAVLAHEIRNPLASLKGHAQLLEEHLGKEKAAKKAHLVVREATRLEELVNRLLDYVRAGDVEFTLTDPVVLLRDSVAASGADAEILTRSAPPQWPLDAMRMQQVLVNLLRNARQAAPNGTVQTWVERDGDGLRFVVSDDGAGLPKELGDAIFEPFRTTRATGVGLGLAVSSRIVQRHDGTLRAENNEAGGARFTVRLRPGHG